MKTETPTTAAGLSERIAQLSRWELAHGTTDAERIEFATERQTLTAAYRKLLGDFSAMSDRRTRFGS